MTKTEMINRRIEFLFGTVGHKKGNFYYDDYYECIYEVVNDGGGVCRVVDVGKPTATIRILDAIAQYKFLKERK